jgi:hypothetical protein
MTHAPKACGNCSFFQNEDRALEAVLEGMTIMGSAFASGRSEDGLCARHDRYLAADSFCADFSAAR